MTKALPRQSRRRSKTPDVRERELKRLRLSVCDDVGFRLYLATYDQPKRRDDLIARVAQEAEAEKVRVARLDLAQAEPDSNLVGLLRAHLKEIDLPPGWRQAVMVTGIEQRLDYSTGRKGLTFLHQANLLRDVLPEAAPVPVVLWLSRVASAALPAEAPDLWHWRAANFDFTGDVAPRVEVLRELTTLRPEDYLGLSGEQRRARIRMLEGLLGELEREGPPTSKRRAAERANLLLDLGVEDLRLGQRAAASPRFERALEVFRSIGDRRGESNALRWLGEANDEAGEPQRAIEYYKQAVVIACEAGDRRGECNALGNLGYVYLELGEPQRAIEFSEQHLAVAREIGERRGEGWAFDNLGTAYGYLGEPRRAIDYYEQALTIARETGERRGEGRTLGKLGRAYAYLDEPRRAIDYYEQAMAILRDIGDRCGEANALGNLGNAYYGLGEARRAIDYYEQHLAIAREVGDRQGEGHSLYGSAVAFDQLGERAEAIRRMEEALRIYEQIEDPNAERARAQLAKWRGEGSGG